MKIKVLFVGPPKVGKSTVANYISEAVADTSDKEYRPTQGVRILEYESKHPVHTSQSIEVELWDCSGDPKFDACWPTFQEDAQGIVLLLDPCHSEVGKHVDRFLGLMRAFRPQQQMIILVSHQENMTIGYKLPEFLSHIRRVKTELRDAKLLKEMANFIHDLESVAHVNKEKEELNFVGLN